jgi:hypothetical protein
MENNTETPIAQDTDNLDDFELLFTGKATPLTEVEVSPEEDTLATNEPIEDIENLDDIEVEVEDSEDDKLKVIPKKKQSAQERINDLTAKYRNEERLRQEEVREKDELRRKLEETLAKLNTVTPEVTKTDDTPNPDDVTTTGDPKYPLGEFDPNYIRDLTKYTITQERNQMRQEEERIRQERDIQQARQTLQVSWNEKVQKAEQELPDLRTKVQALDPILSSLPPQLGEYLSSTIMALDNGPAVLHYLADNIDEARRIVASGATSATLALGRLDALYSKPATKPTRVTEAPEPPLARTKGASAAIPIPDDTDDLSAFEKKFYR